MSAGFYRYLNHMASIVIITTGGITCARFHLVKPPDITVLGGTIPNSNGCMIPLHRYRKFLI